MSVPISIRSDGEVNDKVEGTLRNGYWSLHASNWNSPETQSHVKIWVLDKITARCHDDRTVSRRVRGESHVSEDSTHALDETTLDKKAYIGCKQL